MKRMSLAAIAICAASAAVAESDWKDKALAEILTLQDVVEGRWAESGALWLTTDKEKQYLPVYTEQVVCAQAYFADKPKGEMLQITWHSASAVRQGRLERITSLFCKG